MICQADRVGPNPAWVPSYETHPMGNASYGQCFLEIRLERIRDADDAAQSGAIGFIGPAHLACGIFTDG